MPMPVHSNLEAVSKFIIFHFSERPNFLSKRSPISLYLLETGKEHQESLNSDLL